jgi:hypothetical protein
VVSSAAIDYGPKEVRQNSMVAEYSGGKLLTSWWPEAERDTQEGIRGNMFPSKAYLQGRFLLTRPYLLVSTTSQ